MTIRHTLAAALAAIALAATSGCAVTRGQESAGNYIDDTAVTTAVKSRFVESELVDASSISVETMRPRCALAVPASVECAWIKS